MNTWLPVFTLVCGWIVGLVSSVFIERFKSRQALLTRMFEHYLLIRSELTNLVSDLAQLHDRAPFTAESTEDYRKAISKLFFKHYDFLPPEVLVEMNCLHSCLKSQGKWIFRHSDERGIFRLDLRDTRILAAFIDGISLVRNYRYHALLALRDQRNEVRSVSIINCQARSVLVTLGRFFVPSRIMAWQHHIAKFSNTFARPQ